MKFKTRSVRTYLVIPVLILGIFSVIALAMSGLSLRNVNGISNNIAQKQIRNIGLLLRQQWDSLLRLRMK